jgi:hypothetical protein
MTALEAGLRGSAIAVLLLLTFFGWRDARQAAVARYGILFVLCGAAYLVESAPGLSSSQAIWVVPLRLLSMATPGVFLIWTSANFDDSFTPSWTSWLPAAAMVALAALAIVLDRAIAWRVAQAAALVLTGIGIWQVLGGAPPISSKGVVASVSSSRSPPASPLSASTFWVRSAIRRSAPKAAPSAPALSSRWR